jgi:hypothetical protein
MPSDFSVGYRKSIPVAVKNDSTDSMTPLLNALMNSYAGLHCLTLPIGPSILVNVHDMNSLHVTMLPEGV